MYRESVEFNGFTFYRYPNSPHKHCRVYYTPGLVDRIRYDLESLHREVWKAAYGEIPTGMEIHHSDFNPLNNEVSNLECLTKAEHAERHRSPASDQQRQHLE